MTLHKQSGNGPQRALVITGVALGLGLVFDWLFYEKLPGISFVIYVALVLAAMLVLAARFRVKLSQSGLLLIPAIMCFAWMVFMRANGLITFLNVMMTLFLLGLLVGTVLKPRIRQYAVADYLRTWFLPLEFVIHAQRNVKELGVARKLLRRHPATAQILRGLLITLPVLFVFVLLLSSADMVFRKYTTDLLDFQINSELPAHLFLIGIVSVLLSGAFAFLTHKPGKDTAPAPDTPPTKRQSSLGVIETSMLFGSLNVLFLGFIAVQLTYLFGGEQNVIGQGFTYAEYARKGFFELIAVSVLTLVVVLVAEKTLLRKGEKHSAHFKFLAGALVAQVLVIMLSAFNRLSLYESAYGFTTQRLISHAFIVWLAALFGILLYKIFVDQRETTFAFLSFVSVLLLLGTLNLINVDAFVARQNIVRYERTGKLDTAYLYDLSPDSLPEIARLLDAKDKRVRDDVSYLLHLRYLSLRLNDEHWQSANAARKDALRALEAKKSRLDGRVNPIPAEYYRFR